MTQLEVRSRAEWRRWLERNHDRASEAWVVFHKQSSGRRSGLSYEDSVEEALCFGWVDSLVKGLDDSRYLRKFTPRKPDSAWSTSNRRRYEKLKAQGLLAPAGITRAPTSKSGDVPRPSITALAKDIRTAVKANPRAWAFFHDLAPSHKRNYIIWIESAKRPETRTKRLTEAVRLLASGKKLGLK